MTDARFDLQSVPMMNTNTAAYLGSTPFATREAAEAAADRHFVGAVMQEIKDHHERKRWTRTDVRREWSEQRYTG